MQESRWKNNFRAAEQHYKFVRYAEHLLLLDYRFRGNDWV
jgi:hypothetical protein